jgi:hypothetical protein
MKKLRYLLVMAVILIAGCATDDTMFETQDNLELKSANATIPFKADCWAIPNMDTPGRLDVGGTGTRLGKINPEESFYQFLTNGEGEDEHGVPCYHLTGFGKMVGANGDGMEFTFKSRQYLDGSFIGVAEITPESGTGKFKGSTGSIDNFGATTMDGIWFKAIGYLEFK